VRSKDALLFSGCRRYHQQFGGYLSITEARWSTTGRVVLAEREAEVSTTTIDASPLTAADRCDRCGAQAYVRAVLGTSELLFCGHHWHDNEARLREISSHIQDETARLSAVPATAALDER
jgi:hypothetical protein